MSRRCLRSMGARLCALFLLASAFGPYPGLRNVAFASQQGFGTYDRLHLVVPSSDCENTNDYWGAIKAAGLETLPFDSAECASTEVEVQAFIGRLLAEVAAAPGQKTALVAGAKPKVTNGGLIGEKFFAEALRSGVSIYFIAAQEMQFEKYGLDPAQHLAINLWPNTMQGGKFIGSELCRIASTRPQRVLLLYGKEAVNDVRLDEAIVAFRSQCPGTPLEVAYKRRGDWSMQSGRDITESVMVIDSGITAVLAANDRMAIGALQAANEYYPVQNLNALKVSGYTDEKELNKPYIERQTIFATVDEQMTAPNAGLWKAVRQMLVLTGRLNITSTSSLLAKLGLESSVLPTDVVFVSSDPDGYVISFLDEQYRGTVRALPDSGAGATNIFLGLHDIQVESINTAGGTFDATFWIQMEWTDKRLEWDPRVYNGTIQRSAGSIWEPAIYIRNIKTSQVESRIYETSATVSSNGHVRKAIKFFASMTCDMNVRPYPFDIHTCAIKVTVGSRGAHVRLVQTPYVQLTGMPEGYLGEAIVVAENTPGEDVQDTPLKWSQSQVLFSFEFQHDPSFSMSSHILIGWGLNLVSFGQFWIPITDGSMDRSGLAVTTILAAVVLQAEAKTSLIVTWQDIFFSISIAFEFIAFFITVMSGHYVSDPDYISEDWKRQNYTEERREKEFSHFSMRSTTEAGIEDTPRSVSAVPSSIIRKNEYLEINHVNMLLVFCDSILGDEFDIFFDRWGRRYIVPVFLVINCALPFLPWSGDMDISAHPSSGASCELFIYSFMLLLFYLAVVLSRAAIVYKKSRVDKEKQPQVAAVRSASSPRSQAPMLNESARALYPPPAVSI